MAKRPAGSGGRQNPLPPELPYAVKARLREVAAATGLSYEKLESNAKRLVMQPEELDRLMKLIDKTGL